MYFLCHYHFGCIQTYILVLRTHNLIIITFIFFCKHVFVSFTNTPTQGKDDCVPSHCNAVNLMYAASFFINRSASACGLVPEDEICKAALSFTWAVLLALTPCFPIVYSPAWTPARGLSSLIKIILPFFFSLNAPFGLHYFRLCFGFPGLFIGSSASRAVTSLHPRH